MNDPLPTSQELEKLPLRAVVAYAARTARRLGTDLRGIIADEILDDALRLVDTVWTTDLIGQAEAAAVMQAAARIPAAYAEAPVAMKSQEKFDIVFSLTHAAAAATFALLPAVDPENARWQMKNAAKEAQRVFRPLEFLNTSASSALTTAARRDYDILLREYGEHDDVVIGDPVDCFDD